jgi:DNA-binding MarR family transcriptional regulator
MASGTVASVSGTVAADGEAPPEATPGNDAVQQAWRALITTKVAAWNSLERALGERFGLGVSDFEVLERLTEKPDHACRLQDLADAVHLSQSALSRLTDRLERHGLVERCACDMDRRGINVVLTEAGVRKHLEALPTHREILARTLPPELIARFE